MNKNRVLPVIIYEPYTFRFKIETREESYNNLQVTRIYTMISKNGAYLDKFIYSYGSHLEPRYQGMINIVQEQMISSFNAIYRTIHDVMGDPIEELPKRINTQDEFEKRLILLRFEEARNDYLEENIHIDK